MLPLFFKHQDSTMAVLVSAKTSASVKPEVSMSSCPIGGVEILSRQTNKKAIDRKTMNRRN